MHPAKDILKTLSSYRLPLTDCPNQFNIIIQYHTILRKKKAELHKIKHALHTHLERGVTGGGGGEVKSDIPGRQLIPNPGNPTLVLWAEKI